MQIVKQLGFLVEQATSDSHIQPPLDLYEKILALINSRVDIPKHTLNAVSKRLSIKNKKVLFFCFDLLQYLSYRCELSLFSQIANKQFLLKISGLLMAQDIDPSVQTKIMQTIKCWEELFRPHQDLIPLFFQFYAGLLRKQFPLQKDYASPHKPKNFQIYKKPEPKINNEDSNNISIKSKPKKVQATKSEQKTFEQIRQKLILTNQIIDNVNPAEGVKSNALLLEMMDQIKGCQKKINQTINQNPNETIMELALAANDQIYITYRRYKDLQKNRKPEPFILSELASDIVKEKEKKNYQKQEKPSQKVIPQKKKDQFDSFNQKPSPSKIQKIAPKKVQIDIFDLACEPVKTQKSSISTNLMDLTDLQMGSKSQQKQPAQVNIFQLLGSSINPPQQKQPQPQSSNFAFAFSSNNGYQQNDFLQSNAYNFNSQFANNTESLKNNSAVNNYQSNTISNVSLNNNFQTQNDMAKYDDRSLSDKLTDLSGLFKK